MHILQLKIYYAKTAKPHTEESTYNIVKPKGSLIKLPVIIFHRQQEIASQLCPEANALKVENQDTFYKSKILDEIYGQKVLGLVSLKSLQTNLISEDDKELCSRISF